VKNNTIYYEFLCQPLCTHLLKLKNFVCPYQRLHLLHIVFELPNLLIKMASFNSFNSRFCLVIVYACLLFRGNAFVATTSRSQVVSKTFAPSSTIGDVFVEHNTRFERRTTSLASDRTSTFEELEDTLAETEAKVSLTLGEKYSKLTSDYYLTMAFLQSAVIALGADVLTQKLEGTDPIDFGHVFAIMVVAATVSGSMNAFFLRKLENILPGKGTKNVAIKSIVSTFLIGGAINAAYLIGVPLLDSTIFNFNDAIVGPHLPPMDTDVIFKGWTTSEFITLTKVECLMFLPYHSLAYNFVPPQLRPLTQAGMAGTFNVIVSAVTLGFFDIWCDRTVCFFQHLL